LAYEACLTHELVLAGHTVERQVPVSLRYRDLVVPNAFRMAKRGIRRFLMTPASSASSV
jgi:hypothetical protein